VEAGKQLGRPKISTATEKRIQGLLRAKNGMLAAAKECGVGTRTVQRIAREVAGLSAFRLRKRGGMKRFALV
jgi:hypothetical protein